MAIFKMIPLMIYFIINKSKSKGLGNLHTYCISAISVLFTIHLIQLLIIIGYFLTSSSVKQDTYVNQSGSLIIFLLLPVIGFLGIHYLLSKIYTKNKLVKWYSEYKENNILKLSIPIVFTYFLLNLILIFVLAFYLHQY